MLYGAHSAASDFVSCPTAPLVIAYTDIYGSPTNVVTAADVNDLAALTAFDHARAYQLCELGQPMQVGLHNPVVLLACVRFEAPPDVHTGHVREDVHTAALERFLRRAADGVRTHHVEHNGASIHLLRQFIELVFGTCREDQMGSRFMHAARYSKADAARGARHQRGLSFQRKGIQKAILSPQLATVKGSYEFFRIVLRG